MHALVNSSKVPHYGNDDLYADELARLLLFLTASIWKNALQLMAVFPDYLYRKHPVPTTGRPDGEGWRTSSGWRISIRLRDP